jgi:hypothetical protein
MKHVRKLGIGAAALTFIILGIQACSSEPAAAPSRPPIPPPIVDVDGGPDGGGGGGDGGDGGPQSSCFDTTQAKPTTPTNFLNQCNSTECFKFDNAARIEAFKPGALPALN